MHEVLILRRCDFCTQEIDEKDKKARFDVQMGMGNRVFLVDACGVCAGEWVEPLEETLNERSRPSGKRIVGTRGRPPNDLAPKNGRSRTSQQGDDSCPECGHPVNGKVGLRIHQAAKHGYESPQKADRLVREAQKKRRTRGKK